jgi:hypothetical protein
VLVEDLRIEDNTVRPPSALGYLTPTNYAKAWTTNHPELSYRVDQQPGSGQTLSITECRDPHMIVAVGAALLPRPAVLAGRQPARRLRLGTRMLPSA